MWNKYSVTGIMFLFRTDTSRFIKRFYLISSKYFLFPRANMVKLSKEWNPPRNLSDEEFEDLQNLSKNINLSDKRNNNKKKSYKRNSVIILNKDICIKHMESLLSNKNRFEKVDTKNNILNSTVNH